MQLFVSASCWSITQVPWSVLIHFGSGALLQSRFPLKSFKWANLLFGILDQQTDTGSDLLLDDLHCPRITR